MGIHGLTPFLKKKIGSDIVKQIPVQQLKGLKLAVDLSIYINTFAMSSQEFWLNLLTDFLVKLIKSDINLIIVFDGTESVPIEKMVERESRKSSQQKNQLREQNLSHFKEKLLLTCFDLITGETTLVPESLQEELLALCRLGKDENINLRDPEDVLRFVTTKLSRAEQAAEGITKRHKDLARSLIVSLGLPYIQANGEAEALCASMAVNGLVDGVLSRDTDTLTYGCQMLVTEIKKNEASVLYIKDILKGLNFTMKQFIDLCIGLGCDYNKNIPKHGPAAVFKAITEYGSIDEWKKVKPDLPFHILKWQRCREIFRPYSKSYLDRCKITVREPNENQLDEIYKEVASRYTGKHVLACLRGEKSSLYIPKEMNLLDDIEE